MKVYGVYVGYKEVHSLESAEVYKTTATGYWTKSSPLGLGCRSRHPLDTPTTPEDAWRVYFEGVERSLARSLREAARFQALLAKKESIITASLGALP